METAMNYLPVSRSFDYYRHTLRAQMSLGPRSSSVICVSPFSLKRREIWDSCKYVQARFLKPDALEAPSTAKVLLLKKIFFVLDQFNYAVSSIKPPFQSLIRLLPLMSPPPLFWGRKLMSPPLSSPDYSSLINNRLYNQSPP